MYEWLNPAHGNASIILHVLGYAAGMFTIFILVRNAIVARNVVAQKMQKDVERSPAKKSELDSQSDAWSDTWSAEVQVVRPKEVHRHDVSSPV